MKNDICRYCKGKGWILVQNGPDDVEQEPCVCSMNEYEEEVYFGNLIKDLSVEIEAG